MQIQRFLAGRTGPHPLPDGEPADFVVHDLGTLKLPSGRLALAETSSLESPVIVPVEPGEYRVELTSAGVDEYYDVSEARFAYVSLVLSEAEPVTVEPAVVEPDTVQWRTEPQGGIAGVPGLHGVNMSQIACLALADAEALPRDMPGEPETWYDSVLAGPDGGLFQRMDEPEAAPRGTVQAELPNSTTGDTITLVIARELQYPILATRDREGKLTGIHVDMLVVGELAETLQAFDGQSEWAQFELEEAMRAEVLAEEAAEQRNRGFGGWLRGVFGGK